MKMWKAMLIGAQQKPQCIEDFWKDGGSCALGAVLDASGGAAKGDKANDAEIWLRFPKIMAALAGAGCPACQRNKVNTPTYVYVNPLSAIPHLNDDHRWTREVIAEWVKTFEDGLTREKWAARKAKRAERFVQHNAKALEAANKILADVEKKFREIRASERV